MNYYQIILIKIDYLIEHNDYFKALTIVQKELSAPYLDEQFQKKLQKKSQKIIKFLQKISDQKKQQKNNPFKNKFTFDLINKILLKNENIERHPLLFSFIDLKNLPYFLKTIKTYLLSKKYCSKNKTFLLIRLKDIGCQNEFLVNKEHFSKIIVPSNLPQEIQKIEQKILVSLEIKYSHKDLSFFQIAKAITSNYFSHFYPVIPFIEKPKVLLATIIYRSFLSLNKTKNLHYISDHFKISFQDLRKTNNFFEVHSV